MTSFTYSGDITKAAEWLPFAKLRQNWMASIGAMTQSYNPVPNIMITVQTVPMHIHIVVTGGNNFITWNNNATTHSLLEQDWQRLKPLYPINEGIPSGFSEAIGIDLPYGRSNEQTPYWYNDNTACSWVHNHIYANGFDYVNNAYPIWAAALASKDSAYIISTVSGRIVIVLVSLIAPVDVTPGYPGRIGSFEPVVGMEAQSYSAYMSSKSPLFAAFHKDLGYAVLVATDNATDDFVEAEVEFWRLDFSIKAGAVDNIFNPILLYRHNATLKTAVSGTDLSWSFSGVKSIAGHFKLAGHEICCVTSTLSASLDRVEQATPDDVAVTHDRDDFGYSGASDLNGTFAIGLFKIDTQSLSAYEVNSVYSHVLYNHTSHIVTKTGETVVSTVPTGIYSFIHVQDSNFEFDNNNVVNGVGFNTSASMPRVLYVNYDTDTVIVQQNTVGVGFTDTVSGYRLYDTHTDDELGFEYRYDTRTRTPATKTHKNQVILSKGNNQTVLWESSQSASSPSAISNSNQQVILSMYVNVITRWNHTEQDLLEGFYSTFSTRYSDDVYSPADGYNYAKLKEDSLLVLSSRHKFNTAPTTTNPLKVLHFKDAAQDDGSYTTTMQHELPLPDFYPPVTVGTQL